MSWCGGIKFNFLKFSSYFLSFDTFFLYVIRQSVCSVCLRLRAWFSDIFHLISWYCWCRFFFKCLSRSRFFFLFWLKYLKHCLWYLVFSFLSWVLFQLFYLFMYVFFTSCQNCVSRVCEEKKTSIEPNQTS